MIIDYENTLSDAQEVTASAASTNSIDLRDTTGDFGISDKLFLVLRVDTAAEASGSATVAFSVQCDDDSAFGSPKTLLTTAAVAKATLVAGYRPLVTKIPQGCERYLRVYYTVASGPLTAGKFDAFLTPDVQASY